MSKRVIMSKKILVFLIIIILAVASGGFFWWKLMYGETPPDKWERKSSAKQKDYVINETEGRMLVKNQETGFSLQLPKNWSQKQSNNKPLENDISFYSPMATINNKNNLIQEGCKIIIGISRIRTNIDTLKEVLKKKFVWDSIILDEYKNVKVSGKEAIKHIFEDEKLKIYFVGIHIPAEDNLFEIVLEAAPKDKTGCEKEFNQVILSISY